MVKHLCHLGALNFVCDSVIKFTRQWMCNKIFYWNIEYFLMVLPLLFSITWLLLPVFSRTNYFND